MIKIILAFVVLWIVFASIFQVVRTATNKELLTVGKIMLYSLIPTTLSIFALTTFVILF